MALETILVTDAGLNAAISVIRSLRRAGYRVIAADKQSPSAGQHSRYASGRWIYPDPASDPAAFVASIEEAVTIHDVRLLFPATESTILPLAAERERFQGRCILAAADDALLRTAADKGLTMRDAQRLGIPTPATRHVRSVDEAIEAARELGWPLVVKPRASRAITKTEVRHHTVSYAGDESELRERVAALLAAGSDVLLQSWCPGRGVSIDLLMHEGHPLLSFQHGRLREFPVHGGPGALRQSEPIDPQLLDYALKLLGDWKWTGLAMVEFKQGAKGTFLMEVNGRIWGSMPLPIFSGVDFPRHYVELLLNQRKPDPAQNGHYKLGLRARNLGADLMWVVAVLAATPRRKYAYLPTPPRAAAVRAALQLLNPTIRNDVQSLRDPLPGLVDIWLILAKIYRKAGHRET